MTERFLFLFFSGKGVIAEQSGLFFCLLQTSCRVFISAECLSDHTHAHTLRLRVCVKQQQQQRGGPCSAAGAAL